jgi:hypothetical protein
LESTNEGGWELSNVRIQYPDLTEVLNLDFTRGVFPAKTEFVFSLKALNKPGDVTDRQAEREGFKLVSSMNNWWPTHAGQTRRLNLYWHRAKEPVILDPFKANRTRWHFGGGKYAKIQRHLAASGCGFKIGLPPFKVELFDRFFTLMRLPLKLHPARKKWLEAHNYRFLDSGSIAQYWINGWPPEEWTAEKEYAHFNTTKEEWGLHGMDDFI